MSSSEQAIFANLRASFDFDDAVASGNAVSPHYIPAPPKPESEEAMKVAVAKVHSHHRRLWSKKKSSKTAPKVEAWEAEPQAEPQAEPCLQLKLAPLSLLLVEEVEEDGAYVSAGPSPRPVE